MISFGFIWFVGCWILVDNVSIEAVQGRNWTSFLRIFRYTVSHVSVLMEVLHLYEGSSFYGRQV
jgi:hypothetical protein